MEMYWLGYSAELTLVPWRTGQPDHLDNSLLPQFLLEKKVPVKVFDDFQLTNLLLVGK